MKKTKILLIGSLGIHFGKNAQNLNGNSISEKTDPEFEKWKDRNLSMIGKVMILRTMILSKIWHYAKVRRPRKKFINNTYSKMTKFFGTLRLFIV